MGESVFELSVARKYLTPRWRQLSVSIISLISILVIALVVWLIVVFFSVTQGLEKNWISKLIALTAPVRVLPTEAYYQSYYYQADGLSAASDYSVKSIGDKSRARLTNPYDPDFDAEIPLTWPKADLGTDGQLKDIVKEAFGIIQSLDVPGIQAQDFEMTASTLHLQLLRKSSASQLLPRDQFNQSTLSQGSYVGSFPKHNPTLGKALLPLSMADLSQLLTLSGVAAEHTQEEDPEAVVLASKSLVQSRLKAFFEHVTISELGPSEESWILPTTLYPAQGEFNVVALLRNHKLQRILLPTKAQSIPSIIKGIPRDFADAQESRLFFKEGTPWLSLNGEEIPLSPRTPIHVTGLKSLQAHLEESSIEEVTRASDLRFDVDFSVQGKKLAGPIPLGTLQIHQASYQSDFKESPEWAPLWLHNLAGEKTLPNDPHLGDGILLPRSFKEGGILVGDRGTLSYVVPTASALQEQRAKVFVAGFYDPGIIPLGGKFILAPQNLTSLIHSTQAGQGTAYSNGINIYFDDLNQADLVKEKLQKAFADAGIARYWRVETFREYDFTKDLIQQLRSEKNLFTLLATIIIIVACSNIISMLIILVNDKKTEIGILRSMGASSASIAGIFGVCGIVMGFLGSILGILAALLTLQNLQGLINFISRVQGYEMFNPHFYGDRLPTDISMSTLGYVMVATACISLIAGLVPAIKASLMRPSAILRAE